MSVSVNDVARGNGRSLGLAKSKLARVILALAICALLATVGLGIYRWRQPRMTLEERQARQALVSGDITRALGLIERLLKQAPQSPEAHLLKARAMLALERLPEFAASFEQAEKLGAGQTEVERIRSILRSRQGKQREEWPTLIREYQAERGFDPLLAEAVARIYLENFELLKAGRVIDRWMKESPHDAKPYLWRVEIDRRIAGEATRLIPDYREALKRDPSLARARIGLATELLKMHRNPEAAQEFEAYLALRPEDAKAHVGAGANALEMGDESSAIRHLERAMELDPKNAEAFRERGEIDMRRGDFAAALPRFDRAVAVDPYDLDARYNRSIILSRLGREDEAKAERAISNRLRADNDRLNEIKEKLVQTPHNLKLQLEVAKWMIDHGHGPDGERWVEKILRTMPRQPDACRLLAEYHERNGNQGLANFYRLQIETAPSSKSTGQ